MSNNLAKNLIKVGQVNSVNSSKGSVDVLFDDQDNKVVSDLPLLNFEYNIPKVGDQVLCVFLGNGLEQGFCIGGFYSDISKPPIKNKNIYRKQFDDGTHIQYDKSAKELKITSVNPVKIKGDLSIQGNVSATGTVHGSNIGN